MSHNNKTVIKAKDIIYPAEAIIAYFGYNV